MGERGFSKLQASRFLAFHHRRDALNTNFRGAHQRRLLPCVTWLLSWAGQHERWRPRSGRPSPRFRTVPARFTSFVMSEIKKAKLHFGLPANAPLVACYEASRDGFWIHRL
jgi:hypothetical protein